MRTHEKMLEAQNKVADTLLDLLKKMTDQIYKHFYSLPESNENDGKYWKRLYVSACEAILKAELKK